MERHNVDLNGHVQPIFLPKSVPTSQLVRSQLGRDHASRPIFILHLFIFHSTTLTYFHLTREGLPPPG